MSEVSAHRAAILHCLRDPGDDRDPLASGAVEYFEDGLLVVADGHIVRVGPRKVIEKYVPYDARRIDHGDRLLIPGMVDCHVHYPQVDIIAS